MEHMHIIYIHAYKRFNSISSLLFLNLSLISCRSILIVDTGMSMALQLSVTLLSSNFHSRSKVSLCSLVRNLINFSHLSLHAVAAVSFSREGSLRFKSHCLLLATLKCTLIVILPIEDLINLLYLASDLDHLVVEVTLDACSILVHAPSPFLSAEDRLAVHSIQEIDLLSRHDQV